LVRFLISLVYICSMVMQIALDINLLILAWVLYALLQYCWSGMSKFISILLLPVTLIHVASHYLLAKLLNIKPYVTLSIIPDESHRAGLYTSTNIYRINSWRIGFVAMAPLMISLPMIILLRWILKVAINLGSYAASLIIAWLLISIFVCGLPSLADLGFIASNVIIKHPDTIIALLLLPTIYILGTMAYDNEVAVYGTALYITLVAMASILGEAKKEEIIID